MLTEEEVGSSNPKKRKPTDAEIEYDRRVRAAISQFTSDDLQEEIFDKDTFVMPYLRPPCSLCGSSEHGILRKVGVMGDDLGEEYNCPVAYHSDWNAVKNEAWGERFRLCPRKVAERAYHDMDEVAEILRVYHTDGEGRNMPTEWRDALRSEIRAICEDSIRNMPFKREVKPDVGDEEEDEQDC